MTTKFSAFIGLDIAIPSDPVWVPFLCEAGPCAHCRARYTQVTTMTCWREATFAAQSQNARDRERQRLEAERPELRDHIQQVRAWEAA